ncbi:DUF429 domain-containing protein [Rhodococcus aerolatus]
MSATARPPGHRVAGVDGFAGRWVVCLLDGRRVRFTTADDASGVLALTGDRAAVGVDVPLGLAEDAVRSCEPVARRRLRAAGGSGAASSVFPTPARAVLAAGTYAEACAVSRAVAGKAISKQTWFITPGIRDFDEVGPDPARVVETHPELSLRALAPGVAFVGKKTARGQGQRVAALARWCDLAAGLADLPPGPALDDVLDAVACAWSARRWAAGTADVLGGEPDARGTPMRIVV